MKKPKEKKIRDYISQIEKHEAIYAIAGIINHCDGIECPANPAEFTMIGNCEYCRASRIYDLVTKEAAK